MPLIGCDAVAAVGGTVCKFALLDEIRSHGRALTPGRYVRAEGGENDGESFDVTAKRFAAELSEQFAGLGRLKAWITPNLVSLCYAIHKNCWFRE